MQSVYQDPLPDGTGVQQHSAGDIYTRERLEAAQRARSSAEWVRWGEQRCALIVPAYRAPVVLKAQPWDLECGAAS